MDQIIEWDQQLFLMLNRLHAAWLDPVMFQMSKTQFWLPLHFIIIYLLFKQFEIRAWWVLLTVAAVVLCADQLTSSFMKPFFERLRPTHEPALQGLVHIVNDYRGGRYGFASSHAANTAGAATLLILMMRVRYRWIWLVALWTIIVSYTRIYLGVHYPGDIIVGWLAGILFGWLGFIVLRYFFERKPVKTVKR